MRSPSPAPPCATASARCRPRGLDGPELDVRLLVDHRERLVGQRVGVNNTLLWHLHDLWPELTLPGGAWFSVKWSARIARRLARSEQTMRVRIARDELRRLRELTHAIKALEGEIAELVAQLAPQLLSEPGSVMLLRTIPGIGDLLGLTIASEIGDVSRFSSPRKLIGYAGLAPRISQSGDRSRTGALFKAGSRTLRWAAVEAAHQSWRPTNPWHELYRDITKRAGKNPAKSAVARKVLIATWHVLAREEPFKPARSRTIDSTTVSASSRCFLAP
jgi:transposase